jgi:hypothetical protein
MAAPVANLFSGTPVMKGLRWDYSADGRVQGRAVTGS